MQRRTCNENCVFFCEHDPINLVCVSKIHVDTNKFSVVIWLDILNVAY